MTDYRKPYHDERLAPCPICGGEPWADSKNGTIYCDCGLRYHINGECHPEWHRMDWTADEWNCLANVRTENAELRKLVRDMWLADYAGHFSTLPEHQDHRATVWQRMRELGVEVE